MPVSLVRVHALSRDHPPSRYATVRRADPGYNESPIISSRQVGKILPKVEVYENDSSISRCSHAHLYQLLDFATNARGHSPS